MKYVFAYHEIMRSPAEPKRISDAERCDVWYQGRAFAGLLRLDLSARRHNQHWDGRRPQGLRAPPFGRGFARGDRA